MNQKELVNNIMENLEEISVNYKTLTKLLDKDIADNLLSAIINESFDLMSYGITDERLTIELDKLGSIYVKERNVSNFKKDGTSRPYIVGQLNLSKDVKKRLNS